MHGPKAKIEGTNISEVETMSDIENNCDTDGEEENIEYLTEWPITQGDADTKSAEIDEEPAAKKSKIVNLENEDDSDGDDEDIDPGVTARMALAVWHRRRLRSG